MYIDVADELVAQPPLDFVKPNPKQVVKIQDRVSYVHRKPLKRMPSLQLIVICLSFA